MIPLAPAKASSRGSYAKSGGRRRAIVEAACVEFGERGYAASSLSRIGAALSMSAAGVLHHFPRKELLLKEVLEQVGRALPQAMDVEGDVRSALLSLDAHSRDRPELLRLLSRLETEASDPNHPAHAWFRDRDRVLRHRLEAVVRKGQGQGRVVASCDADVVAAALVALWRGLRVERLADPSADVLPVLLLGAAALAPAPDPARSSCDRFEM